MLDYLYLDASFFRMHPGSPAEPVLAAWGITTDGKPAFIGLAPGSGESADAWHDFLTDLKDRGLPCPLLVISDGASGLISAIEQVFPKALRQRCLIHRARNILAKVPAGMQAEIKDAYWAIFDTEDLKTQPGPELVELVDHRITEMAGRYSATYPAAMKCLLADREGLKPRAAQTLAAWAWAAVGLTPVGWFYGFMAIGYSHLADVTDRNMMFGGVVLFAVSPTTAFILAVYAARAGHRSGKIAVMVSGLLLLATLVVLTLAYWWVGLPVTGVVAVLVLAWMLSRKIAVAVSGLLLLAGLLVSAWLSGVWINAAVIAVMVVIAVPVSTLARSRIKRNSTGGPRVP